MAANQPPIGNIPPAAPAPPAIAVAPQVVPAVAGIAPPAFADNPSALPVANNYINYVNNPEAVKTYYKSVEPLTDKYNGETKGLQMFMHDVKCHAMTFGWDTTLFMVPMPSLQVQGLPIPNYSLFHQYGQITVNNVATHAATYIDIQCKARQDSKALALFLDKSLTPELMMRVLAQQSKYIIGQDRSQDGPTMYRVILSIVGTETAASLSVINTKIRNLPDKMDEFKCNITEYHQYVTSLVNDSLSRGKTPHDLEYILYDSYARVDDPQFVEYIRAKKSLVFDGTSPEIEYTELMHIAGEMYKRLNDSGEWIGRGATHLGSTKVETKEKDSKTKDDHILALTAALQALQKTGTPTKVTKAPNANTGEWKWKDIAPKTGESHFKTFKGKEYVHCPNHKLSKWVLADKHKDGCTIDTSWKFPVKGMTGTVGGNKEDSYLKAMMGLMNDETGGNDENI
jgi:hypothetical protein